MSTFPWLCVFPHCRYCCRSQYVCWIKRGTKGRVDRGICFRGDWGCKSAQGGFLAAWAQIVTSLFLSLIIEYINQLYHILDRNNYPNCLRTFIESNWNGWHLLLLFHSVINGLLVLFMVTIENDVGKLVLGWWHYFGRLWNLAGDMSMKVLSISQSIKMENERFLFV